MLNLQIRINLVILLMTCSNWANGQHQDDRLIDLNLRKEWIIQAQDHLRNVKPDDITNKINVSTIQMDSFIQTSIRVQKEGYIKLKGKAWICFITNSSHDAPQVGDVSLAIDHKKNLYINEGHVCGGIIQFSTYKVKTLKTPRQFFRFFRSDTDDAGWTKVK